MQAVTYLAPGLPQTLFEAMADAMGARLHLERGLSGPAPGEDPFADGRFDLGWICATSYVDLCRRAELDGRSPSIRLAGLGWVPDDPAGDGHPVYFGDLTTVAGSSARSLQDLAGARIGCNDPVSLSGYYALRHAIAQTGADPDTFAELVFTGGHHRSLDRLMAGDLDAAVVDSVVRRSGVRADPAVGSLPVIDRLGPWPVQPLVVRSGLGTAEVDELVARLRRAGRFGRVADELAATGLDRLTSMASADYDGVRAMMTGLD